MLHTLYSLALAAVAGLALTSGPAGAGGDCCAPKKTCCAPASKCCQEQPKPKCCADAADCCKQAKPCCSTGCCVK